ncbi:MAG: hypothetical protein F4154_03340, partial [Candidatus Dadabacteria bacterium]|nr:hypothetical protein [Candidatus Dadabacteria bacterium]
MGAFSLLCTEGGLFILGGWLNFMFPAFSHWIWPIIGFMLLFVGFYPPIRILSKFGVKKDEASAEEKCEKKRRDTVLLLEEIKPLLQSKEFNYENEKLVAEGTRKLYDKLKDFGIPAPSPIYIREESIAAYEFRCRYWLECVERWSSFLNENKMEEAKNVWFHVGNELE